MLLRKFNIELKSFVLLLSIISISISCSYSDFRIFTHSEIDGFSHYYFFQRGNKESLNQNLIIYLDGASLNSALGIEGSILPWKSFSLAYQFQKVFPDEYDLLVPEKRNIEPGEDFSSNRQKLNCTTLNHRVKSAVTAIDKFLSNHYYKNIYLIGYSEGGMIMPKVYNSLNKKNYISKLINLSGGGLSYYELIKHYCKEQAWDTLRIDSVYSEILKDPNSLTKNYFGHPYLKWSDFMKYDPSIEYTIIDIPILILHGTKDKNAPIESAKYLRDKFVSWSKDNLTFIELYEMSHNYYDDFEEISKNILRWIKNK